MRTISGEVIAWPLDTQFTVCAPLHTGDSAQRSLIDGALLWWTWGGLLRPLEISTKSDCSIASDDGQISIIASAGLSEWPEGFGPAEGTLAFTIHTFDAADEPGRLLDADIVLNVGNFTFSPKGEASGSFDLASVVAHEMGHALGLGHPCGGPSSEYPSCGALPAEADHLPEAIMFPSQSVGPQSLQLSADDLNSLKERFPDTLPFEHPPTSPCLERSQLRLRVSEDVSSWFWFNDAEISGPLEANEELAHDGATSSQTWAMLLKIHDGRVRFVEGDSLLPCEPSHPNHEDTAAPDMFENAAADIDTSPPSSEPDCQCSIRQGEAHSTRPWRALFATFSFAFLTLISFRDRRP